MRFQVIGEFIMLIRASLIAILITGASTMASEAQHSSPAGATLDGTNLKGTWVMAAAYEILADGTRTTNYGEHPRGLLMIDAQGRYSLQIFRVNRPKFASGDKTRGTADEYREAVLGSSTHTGRV